MLRIGPGSLRLRVYHASKQGRGGSKAGLLGHDGSQRAGLFNGIPCSLHCNRHICITKLKLLLHHFPSPFFKKTTNQPACLHRRSGLHSLQLSQSGGNKRLLETQQQMFGLLIVAADLKTCQQRKNRRESMVLAAAVRRLPLLLMTNPLQLQRRPNKWRCGPLRLVLFE